MRCHICNSVLSPTEVQFNRDHKDWDPCGKCLDAISEVFNDDDEETIDAQILFEFSDDEGELEAVEDGEASDT